MPAPGSVAAQAAQNQANAASPNGSAQRPAANRPGANEALASRPIVTSLQGLRYAPGRTGPSMVQPIQTDRALWLGVPFMTQMDGTTYASVNCGPASTAMVLGAFGIRTTPGYIRDYANYISGAYSTDIGTSLGHLSRVAREAGLEVSYTNARWSVDMLRGEIQAGRPVVTLVKYRALPGNAGSLAAFDHYIIIAGLAGQDFIYNDAAFGGDRGYGLLISPADLEQAWDYSSIPRHGMSVGLSSGGSPLNAALPPIPRSAGVAKPPTSAAPAAAAETPLDMGELVPDEAGVAEDLLPEHDPFFSEGPLSLGEQLRLQGDINALSFQRIKMETPAQPAVLGDVVRQTTDGEKPKVSSGLDLANFVVPVEPAPAQKALASASTEARQLPDIRQTIPLPITRELFEPLIWASIAALAIAFTFLGRRAALEW